MATSNSRNFSVDTQNIIKSAFKNLGIYNINATVGSDDFEFAKDKLNKLAKLWQSDGLKLWNRQQATLFTAFQTASYDLGLSGDHATKSYVSTQLNGALTASATAVTVDSTTGMTAADNIGVTLSDGTRHWDTIASVDTSTTLTLDTGIASAAADDAFTVAYTTKIDRPLQMMSARWFNMSTDNEVDIELVHYEHYFNIPDKTTNDNFPSLGMYDKQLTVGKLYLWPRPDDVDVLVNFTFNEQVEDFDANTDNPDFPIEWSLALEYNLAVMIAPAYGKYPELDKLQAMADKLKFQMEDFNSDDESILVVPTTRRIAIGK